MHRDKEDQMNQEGEDVTPKSKRKWQYYAGQCHLFYKSGDLSGLEVALGQLVSAGAPLEMQIFWQERLAIAKKDYVAVIKSMQARWQQASTDELEILQRRLRKFYRYLDDSEAIMHCAQHALEHAPTCLLSPIGILIKATRETANLEQGEKILRSLYDIHPEKKQLLHTILRQLQDTGINVLRDFVHTNRANIDDKDLQILDPATMAFFLTPRDLVSHVDAIGEKSEEADIKAVVRAASIHAMYGELEEAKNLLTSISTSGMPILGEALLIMIDDIPGDELLTRPILENSSMENEVLICETPDAVGTVIVFTGLGDQAMVPTTVLDRYFSALKLSAVYLRDFQRYMYIKGVSELGKDLSETLSSLRDILADLKTKRLFTFATSAGGFGAMRYGLALGAESVICFSPVVHIHEEETRAKIILRRLLQEFQPEERDVRFDFAKHETSTTRVDVYYGADHSPDCAQAELLQSTRHVTLHKLDDYKEHVSLSCVVSRQGFFQTVCKHFRIDLPPSLEAERVGD